MRTFLPRAGLVLAGGFDDNAGNAGGDAWAWDAASLCCLVCVSLALTFSSATLRPILMEKATVDQNNNISPRNRWKRFTFVVCKNTIKPKYTDKKTPLTLELLISISRRI
jgi:hypothetical protein